MWLNCAIVQFRGCVRAGHRSRRPPTTTAFDGHRARKACYDDTQYRRRPRRGTEKFKAVPRIVQQAVLFFAMHRRGLTGSVERLQGIRFVCCVPGMLNILRTLRVLISSRVLNQRESRLVIHLFDADLTRILVWNLSPTLVDLETSVPTSIPQERRGCNIVRCARNVKNAFSYTRTRRRVRTWYFCVGVNSWPTARHAHCSRRRATVFGNQMIFAASPFTSSVCQFSAVVASLCCWRHWFFVRHVRERGKVACFSRR